MTECLSRRTLLKRTGALAAAAAVKCPLLLAGPSPNSALRTAVIGCGGRGEASVEAAAGERLAALVDVDDGRVAAAAKSVAQRGAKPATFFDYRRMFDAMHKDIDAVFVAAPDHHHAPASMIAIQLGKHVFCEKPLCHDVHQARALAEAAKKHNVITLMGNQGHCGEGYRRLCEYVWAGAIGDIVETHSWIHFVNGGVGGRPQTKPVPSGLHWDQWLGPAPYREYHDGLHPLYWRYWWDFGTGGLGDWGCHNLDGAFWALGISHPTGIECITAVGGSDEKYPQGNHICWDIPAAGGKPAAKVHWYDGGQVPPMLGEFEKKYHRNFREGWNGGTFYIGTKGIMHTASYGESPRILPEEAHRAYPVPEPRIPRIKGTHFDHFIRCCKSGKPTCADFQYAAAITEFLLLGHLAIKAGVGTPVHWDHAAARCTNLPELNRWLRRPCRKGWEV
jgi:predicted dehydrogenase